MTAQATTVVVAAALGNAAPAFERRLRRLEGARVVPVASVDAALAALEAQPALVLVVDADSLGSATLELCTQAHERWPGLAMLVLSAAPSRELELQLCAVGELTLCAADSDAELLLGYQKALARARRAEAALPPPRPFGQLLLGQSAAMQRVAQLIERVGPTSATVLIRGESGTGKELAARALHASSPLAAAPFVKIDCTSLPEALLEGELGYEKGAFTGAASRKLGRVELANGGTLFIDEMGELSLPTQAKLLRLLQDRQLERLGGTRTIDVDVRVFAATHRDLESMVERGQFRQDLFYRLNVVPVWLPPLRARRDDVAELARHFCEEAARRNRRPGSHLTPGAVATLASQRWPGNVRQLQNFVERLVVLSDSDAIDDAAVLAELTRPAQFTTDLGSAVASPVPGVSPQPVAGAGAAGSGAASASEGDAHLSQVVRDAERAAIVRALARAGGNRSDAARLLGVSRSTFYAKLNQYGLL